MDRKVTILGIDPGFDRVGIAVIEKKPNKDILVHSECITSIRTDSYFDRLKTIGLGLERVIRQYDPTAVAIETIYFSKNRKTALQVAEARGVLLFQASRNNLPIFELSPLEIKVAVTGHGKSDKTQIMKMIPQLIDVDKKIKYDDEFDAIAIAISAGAIHQRSLFEHKI